ncbi:Sec23/Sec24 zinc finger protein (macronuclear) [Tetrahymena thermophila SB210]|uniref:Sec23/Sec24 zinc finger protein n=1 Tax=Tetrahymena thermophila (strain SB210) TaxID=312017 RepID=Q22DC0_TETTS|nr:Sec23/Sec24 zinc finger protein [Tetrahymena thermophila SB210]EAR83282.2 Sec23/Sec24 zinc finger protein [Tetrahymena thermophila SB210]|eukprot:XP_001030945.2 Sec23/Sec24 zinc finger protein [Tetrahymena thermophila SB210]
MSVHQKIIKRGEEKNHLSNSQLQNTSATDNYLRDENDDYDGFNQENDYDQYQQQVNNSYDEQKLGDIMNDSNEYELNGQSHSNQMQSNIQDLQNGGHNSYQKNNYNQAQSQYNYDHLQQQNVYNRQQEQSYQQASSNQQNQIQQSKQYYNNVIKPQYQQANQIRNQNEYDLSDSQEDIDDNNQFSNNVQNVHYSEIEREIYGISKEQEEKEQQYNLQKRREQEEAKLKHQKLLDQSKNKNKQRDSRDYNSSPECIQSSSNYFPINNKIQNECRIPLAISLAPFHEPECLDTVNFKLKKNQLYLTPYMNEEDVPRCQACQTIINPFCEILESLCKWKCNMCFNMQPVPKVYKDQIFNIRAVRPELQHGSYDILLPSKYRVKRDLEVVYWFMIDVSQQSVSNGFLRSTCEGIRSALMSKTMQSNKSHIKIGIIGYDNELHLFNISSRLKNPQIFVYKDLEEQMDILNKDTLFHLNEQTTENQEEKGEKGFFTKLIENIKPKQDPIVKQAIEPKHQKLDYEYPFPDDIVNSFSDCEKHLFTLLDQIEIMYEQKYKNFDSESSSQKQAAKQNQNIFFKALEFSLDHIKFTGGKLFIFHSSLNVQAPVNKNYTIFSIQNKFEDTFITPCIFYQKSMLSRDIVSFVYKITKETNGEIYDISPADIQNKKYQSDLAESITIKQSFESVLRLRCSNGWSISNCMGNTSLRTDTYNLLNMNCDVKTHIILEVQNEIQQNKINYFCFQSCLLFTNTKQQRIMRVHNFILPLTNNHLNIFQSINPKILMTYYSKLYLEQIIHKIGDSKQFETYVTQQLRLLISIQLQCNRAALLPCMEIVILSILGLFKQKNFLQKDIPQGLDSALNQIISYQRMSPTELDSQFVPIIFDLEEIKNSKVYDEKGQYVFPKSLSLSYQSIYDKEIILGDFGKEFIIFIISANVQQDTLKSVFNTTDLTEIKKKTKDEFYKNTSSVSEKVMILLNSLSYIKTRSYVDFSIIITDQGDPREFEFYYKLIEDKYESFQKGYNKSYEEFVDELLKQIN